MKYLTFILFSFIFSSQVIAGHDRVFEITITNLTKGQPFTPAVVVSSNKSFQMYYLGQEASDGLKDLAKDGKTSLLKEELSGNQSVHSIEVGSGLILPGKSETIVLKAKRRESLSFVTMLAKTNDAFTGINQVSLNIKKGHSVSYLTKVYDAGAELNNESKDFIPGLGSSGVDTESFEGFVHPHPGVYNIADLNPVTDAFSSIVSKLTIKRIK